MYFVGVGFKASVHCLGVATATAPAGPFKDRGIVACADSKGNGYIDPAPFIDAGGKAYLYFSVDNPYHSISVLPLSADLLRATGPRKELFTLTQPWEHGTQFSTVEGPFVVKRGAAYELFYSGNDWQHDYAMGVASAHSPLGPFTKYPNNPILHNVRGATGPGAGRCSRMPMAIGGWPTTHGPAAPATTRAGCATCASTRCAGGATQRAYAARPPAWSPRRRPLCGHDGCGLPSLRDRVPAPSALLHTQRMRVLHAGFMRCTLLNSYSISTETERIVPSQERRWWRDREGRCGAELAWVPLWWCPLYTLGLPERPYDVRIALFSKRTPSRSAHRGASIPQTGTTGKGSLF